MTIAYWCVLVAILLPYVWFSVVNSEAGKTRDNDEPRDFVSKLEGKAKRAWGAHLNSFEANTGFVAGVIIAHLAHAPQAWIDGLAVAFIVLRIVHGILYISGVGSVRSLVWVLSLACTVGLFVIGAF